MKRKFFINFIILFLAICLIGFNNSKSNNCVDGEVKESIISENSNVGESKDGFQPTEDSTWGDLYRYFDLEGFEDLSEKEQSELDDLLLTEESPQWVIKEDGKWFFE